MRRAALACVALAASVAAAQDLTVEGGCRDGQPHGAYELRTAGGAPRVVGAFNRGRRTGTFLFWSGSGARVALLPFDDDALSGTVTLWYAAEGRGGEPRPRLEAAHAQGLPSGWQRSWYPNGRLRAEFRYERGTLVAAHAFSEQGRPLPEGDARALALRDTETNGRYVASLDALVRAHLPRCDPAADRLEKG